MRNLINVRVWSAGIAAMACAVLHCVNAPPSTVHPVLIISEERLTAIASRVVVSTVDAEEYSLYRISDDTCTLVITYHKYDSLIVDSVAVANDPSALEAGAFHGSGVAQFGYPAQIYGCVSDETGHEVCASCTVSADTAMHYFLY